MNQVVLFQSTHAQLRSLIQSVVSLEELLSQHLSMLLIMTLPTPSERAQVGLVSPHQIAGCAESEQTRI